MNVYEYALAYTKSGLSVIPAGRNKLPDFSLLPKLPNEKGELKATWNPFRETIADEATLKTWFSNGANLAIIGGKISGGLCIVDFDELRFYDAWKNEVGDLADGLPIQKTGKGYHVFFRCPNPGENQKLAFVEDNNEESGRRAAIETRGEGGYVLAEPSLHPNGNNYKVVSGDLSNIPTISQARANALLDTARKLDEMPYSKKELEAQKHREQKATPKPRNTNDNSPINAYNQQVAIETILEKHGYKRRGERFARPGGNNPSVAIKNGKSFHHNSNDPLSDGYWHDAFDIFCYYEHSGDENNAVRAAAEELKIQNDFSDYDIGDIPSEFLPKTITKPIETPKNGNGTKEEQSELRKKLLEESPDHEGHARCVNLLYQGKFAYSEVYRWMYYNGKCWQREDAESRVDRAIVRTLKMRRLFAVQADIEPLVKSTRCYASNIAGIKKQLSSMIVTSINNFDNNPDLLNCNNGTLNLKTGELTPHSPSQLFTYVLDVDYIPEADYTEWIDFIKECVGNNQKLIDYLQMSLGYSITGHTNEEVFHYIFGPTRSGKGTFTETILKMLGRPLAIEADFSTFTADRTGDTQNFDLAPLKPSRFIAASESNKQIPINPAKIKQLTGGNHIRCAFKHGDHFTYRPCFKIWLSSNHPINADVDDNAVWSRVRVIEFPNSHFGKEDKGLKARLGNEKNLQGVLAWIVAGAMIWYNEEHGLPYPECVKVATEKQRESLDYIQLFIDEKLSIVDKTEFISSGTLHAEYTTWCEENGVKAKYQNKFTQALAQKGYETGREYVTGGILKRVIYGLKLKPIAPI